jgi:hypothetical protein
MARDNSVRSAALLLLAAVAFPAELQAQAAPVAAPSDASADARLSLAREIIDLGVPPATREAMFFKVVDDMTVQMRGAVMQSIKVEDREAIAILDRWLDRWIADSKGLLSSHIPPLMEGWAVAYADIYTERELTDIRAFVRTPSGAAFFQKMQDVLSSPKFAAANQAYMTDIMGRLPAARDELLAEITAYQEKRALEQP